MEILIPKPGTWYAFSPYNEAGWPRLLGPFHDSGDPWQTVKLGKSELNYFSQGLRLFEETSVFHRKIDGKIHVIPALMNAVNTGKRDPFSEEPIFEVRAKSLWGEEIRVRTILGLLFHGSTSFMSWGPTAHYIKREKDRVLQVRADYNHYGEPTWGIQKTGFQILNTTSSSYTYRAGFVTGNFSIKEESTRKGESEAKALARKYYRSGDTIDSVEYSASKFFVDEPDFSMSKVKTWIDLALKPELFDGIKSLNPQSYGDLVHEAAGNLDALSANMIAFLMDLRNIKSLVPKLRELGKIKTHADNYLSYQYGVLPTLSDLQAIWQAFSPVKYYNRQGFRRVSAYDNVDSIINIGGTPAPIRHSRRVHLAVNENDTGLDALVERARNIGVFPSLTNLWDLVPYSFVLDWFIDVGSVLERIDTKHRLSNLDIPYVILTDKIEVDLKISEFSLGIGGSFIITDYQRHVTTDVPQPRIFGDLNKPPSVQNHWIEGSALILQRTKN